MTLRQDRFKLQKYLKPTQAASYGAGLGVHTKPRVARPWRRVGRPIADFLHQVRVWSSDHILSNMLVAGVWVLSRPAAAEKATTSELALPTKMRFALHWIGALLLLILTLPLFFLVGLAIKLDSPGPVFFRQERVGLNRRKGDRRRRRDSALHCRRCNDRRSHNMYGRPFSVFKFRTMVVDAEKRCGPIWATRNDPRVTSVGRFLRKTRLDELPQLINVLRGEMALVGPRPERPYFVEKLSGQIENYTDRLSVKPGITGLAQVENGYDGSVDDVRNKVKYDLAYIKSSSLRHDLLILIKTIGVVFGCRGI